MVICATILATTHMFLELDKSASRAALHSFVTHLHDVHNKSV